MTMGDLVQLQINPHTHTLPSLEEGFTKQSGRMTTSSTVQLLLCSLQMQQAHPKLLRLKEERSGEIMTAFEDGSLSFTCGGREE